MAAATDIHAPHWTEVRVLFDDGVYAVIAGVYEGVESLGMRWQGRHGGPGFPHEEGAPRWQAVPGYLVEPVLHGLLDELLQRSDLTAREQFVEQILLELSLLKTRVAQI